MKRFAVLLLALLGNLWAGPIALASAETVVVQDNASAFATLEVDLAASGSSLFSIPLDLGSMDVGQWLEKSGLSPLGIHGWNAQTQTYKPLKSLRPGEGFLLAKGPGKLSIRGQRIVAKSVELPLEKGWNLIGVPYEAGIPVSSLQIKLNGKVKPYNPAAEAKWVGGVNTLINGQMTSVALTGSTMLEPWRGYWLYAYQACILQIPTPQSVGKDKGMDKPSRKR